MLQIYSPAALAASVEINAIPEPEDCDPPDDTAPSNKGSFKNMHVLTDLTVIDFSRLMQAMSSWVVGLGCSSDLRIDFVFSLPRLHRAYPSH